MGFHEIRAAGGLMPSSFMPKSTASVSPAIGPVTPAFRARLTALYAEIAAIHKACELARMIIDGEIEQDVAFDVARTPESGIEVPV
jgi:hypothetical protein